MSSSMYTMVDHLMNQKLKTLNETCYEANIFFGFVSPIVITVGKSCHTVYTKHLKSPIGTLFNKTIEKLFKPRKSIKKNKKVEILFKKFRRECPFNEEEFRRIAKELEEKDKRLKALERSLK